MSATRRETTVNGNRTQLWSCDDSAPARRLAAALDRGDNRVNRIQSSTVYDAEVWIANEEAIDAPEGWEIHSVFASSNGATCVRFTEVNATAE